jgi:ABC-type lipoprotein export system ATPase subunit
MSLLELEGVSKRHRRGRRERVVLRGVSLTLEAGELAVVWGQRRSGRSTLLRVAAGLDRPDDGVVRLRGQDLARSRDGVLGDEIGYCQHPLISLQGDSALEEVAAGLLARGVGQARARARAAAALKRTGADACAGFPPAELDSGESLRVALARALVLEPSLIVVDEPIKGVELLARDGILRLLRTIADTGVAVLASAGEPAALSGADRTLALDDGELRGAATPALAPVVALRRSA